MKIELKKFGSFLISRPTGKEAYLALQPMIQGVGKSEKIEIDFAGVNVLTPSWADEFLSPLFSRFQGRVALIHPDNPSVKATLETLEKAGREKSRKH